MHTCIEVHVHVLYVQYKTMYSSRAFVRILGGMVQWRPTSRQVLECLVFRLMRTDEVRKILWYRGRARW